MNSLNKDILKLTSTAVLTSLLATANRYTNERKRRLGTKGNELIYFDKLNKLEYNLSINRNSDLLLVFENGLGLPLESWGYIRIFLKDDFNLLMYNRNNAGFSRSKNPEYLLEEVLKINFMHVKKIVLVAHSIGALAACNMLRKSKLLYELTNKIIFIDGTEPYLFQEYRQDNFLRGEFIQLSAQKAFAGFFGFQWWGLDRYSRRHSYRPDIQEAIRLFESNPKEILASFIEYSSIEVSNCIDILGDKNFEKLIISSSERKTQQRDLSKRYSIPMFIVKESMHNSIISSTDKSLETSIIIKDFINGKLN